MDTKDITQRIYEKADSDLKNEIEKAGDALGRLLCDGCANYISVISKDKSGHVGGEVLVGCPAALLALKEKAFDMHCSERRQKAVDDFMHKVNRLGEEIDELRESIPQ